jgi:hypothetical protein
VHFYVEWLWINRILAAGAHHIWGTDSA